MGDSVAETEGSRPVHIRLLGAVEVRVDDTPVSVGPAKCQLVLGALALSAGEAVPTSRLVDLVWGDESPRTAERTLQSYVTRLRRGLGRETIVRSGAAYRLAVDRDSVDVGRFQRCLEVGDTEAALAEWNGVPLAGLDPAGLAPVVSGLVEQWLSATEDSLSRQLEVDSSSAIGRLTELTAEHPFREGLWELLMLALYRSGRQAEALAAFGDARTHLVEALGVEPGPRLQQIEEMILGHDERLPVARRHGDSAGLPSGTVTFGFSDVERSTQLWATNRDAMAEAMARHDELIREAVDHRGGYVFATGGDSFGVAFRRAADAVGWADDVQTAVRVERWPDGVVLKVRIGLHTGEAEERGGDYFGPPVNVAARIAGVGHGGQTLASVVTQSLARDVEAQDLGTFRLQDIVAPQRIVQLDDGIHPRLRTDQDRTGNLPRRVGGLIGRHHALDLLDEALRTSPLVTLVGPGGIGKTRLAVVAAQQAAIDLRGGGWFIDLAEGTSPADVPRLLAEVLNVKESPGQPLASSIVDALTSRECIVILDNCEHVLRAAAELAQAITQGCPQVRLLATSREALGLDSEQLIAVAPLDPEGSAVELFAERARALDQGFDLDGHREDVAEICRRLDGVPLAIELAAARSRTLSPPDLLDRLDDHLRLLSAGRRVGVERHRTLRSTIRWSYDLLTPREQVLFQRLTIFAGTFDLGAAQSVASAEDLPRSDVDELVAALVDQSMVMVESGLTGRRFRLLETMRQFGAERSFESGETIWVAERHARWCAQENDRIGQLLKGMREIDGVAQLNELWPNLRTAFDWACTSENLEIAASLLRPIGMEIFFRSRSEIGDWVERLLTILPADAEELIIESVAMATTRYVRNRDQKGLQALLERYGPLDDPRIHFAVAQLTDDHQGVSTLAPRSAALIRQTGNELGAGATEMGGMRALTQLGRADEVEAYLNGVVHQYRVGGPPTLLNWTLVMLAYSAMFRSETERAQSLFDELLDLDLPPRTHSLNKPIEARTAFKRGDHVIAFEILHSYVQETLDIDNMWAARLASLDFINMMSYLNRLEDAAHLMGYAEASGILEGPAFAIQIADAAANLAANDNSELQQRQAAGRQLDNRSALEYIAKVLVELCEPGGS